MIDEHVTHIADAAATRSPHFALRVAALGLALCTVLAIDALVWLGRAPSLADLPAARRYWEDLSIAAANYLDRRAPTGAQPLSIHDVPDYRRWVANYVLKTSPAHDLRYWQFWRTIPLPPRFNRGPLHGRDNDDSGRATLLTLGFRLAGGVAPYLPRWLAVLASLPLVIWTLLQFGRGRRLLTGGIFLLACACSPYFIDALALPYSALGFYLLALLTLAGFAAHAFLTAARSLCGHVVATVVAGSAFALCVLCRRGTLLMLPAFVLTVVVAALHVARQSPASALSAHPRLRLIGRPSVRVASATLLSLGLFLAPCLLLRSDAHHETWLGIWEGLGDFDRSKGHVWADSAAKEVLREEGIAIDSRAGIFAIAASQTDAVFRDRVLSSINSDPLWYAAILVKRLTATAGQFKLLPFTPVSGRAVAPARYPNEGAIDLYYALTTPADHLGLGPWRCEMPLPLLWAPLLLLPALAIWHRRAHSTSLLEWRDAGLIGCVALGALGLPVAVTTASAIETQAFVLVYYLGLGFFVEAVVRGVARG